MKLENDSKIKIKYKLKILDFLTIYSSLDRN